MRCRIGQRGQLVARVQAGKLRVPQSMLQQRGISRKPTGIRDGMQHGRMGTRRTQPVLARKTGLDSESGGQLEEQQSRSQVTEPESPKDGENEHPEASLAPSQPSGWSGRSTRDPWWRFHGCPCPETATEQHGHGRVGTPPPPRSSRWKYGGERG